MEYPISIPQSPQGLGVHDTSAVPLIVSPSLDPPPALDAPIKAWAEWYAVALQWPVFPCVGKAPAFPSVHRKNDPRFRGCKGECGKFGHGFHDATLELDKIRFYWWQYPNANIGIPLTDERWALDVDPRNGGDDTLRELEKTYGPLPRTVQSNTGGGGVHMIWGALRQPFPTGKIDLGPGLDVQNLGHYIVVPPSIHPDTHRQYQWEADYGPDDLAPQPPPEWLEALIHESAQRKRSGSSRARSDADRPVAAAGEPIPEGMRENTLTTLAGAMRRTGATVEVMRAALEEANKRCVPPLPPEDLDRIADSIGRYDPAPPAATVVAGGSEVGWGNPPVGWSVQGVPGAVITEGATYSWTRELFAKKNGELLQNVTNIKLILQHHPHWRKDANILWWDSVRGRPMCGDVEIDETLLMEICDWLGRDQRLPITRPSLVERCLVTRCKQEPRDLLQLWLQSLPTWDRVPRLQSWLRTVAGVEDTEYGRETSRVLPVSMVARVLNPGCHYRFVVIFEGEESIGKTALVRALATPRVVRRDGHESRLQRSPHNAPRCVGRGILGA